MIVLTHPRGHVAVTQQAHAVMCGQLGRAWGNERFGPFTPREEVCLAAEEHEIGMVDWDLAPELDPATGLPVTVMGMDPSTHLPLRLHGPQRLMAQSPYAALIASLHHTSFYEQPRVLGLGRRRARQIRAYLRRSAEFQARLRAAVDAPDVEVERNWRLVRLWDGISHALMLGRTPRTFDGVPAAGGGEVDLRLEPRDGAYVLDPWPFAADRVETHVTGRLLEEAFDDQERMRAALAAAPEVTLTYVLVAPS